MKSASAQSDPLVGLFGPGDRLFVTPVITGVLRDRGTAIERAREMYIRHFGEARTLSDVEFRLAFGALLDAVGALWQGTGHEATSTFLEHCRQVGDQLATRRVPFAEFIVALYFFEDACLAVEGLKHDTRTDRAFDRLSHQVIGAVAGAFVSRISGEAAALRVTLERDIQRLAPSSRTVFHGLVGKSPAMRRLFARLGAAAPRKTTVLLVGETGTGKELCARAIHELSDRRRGPFVPVNCAAIPREILASELFGHRKGAFTGAISDSRGLIASAEHGTLFLDEVTEMDEAAQVALLRVLEEHAVRPIGSAGERPVDVRFVAATNREPEEAVAMGKLRLDLFHRLAATTIEVPPLRERMEDLPILVEYLLARYAAAESTPRPSVSDDAMEALKRYSWPGNVRELANCLESAATFTTAGLLQATDLPDRVFRTADSSGRMAPRPASGAYPHPTTTTPLPAHPAESSRMGSPPNASSMGNAAPAGFPQAPPASSHASQPLRRPTIHEAELEQIRQAIAEFHGNKAAAARALGISRKRLYAKLRELEGRTGDDPADSNEDLDDESDDAEK